MSSGERPTSLYLDAEAKSVLDDLVKNSGISRSQVMRSLIMQAGANDQNKKVVKLVKELAELVGAK